MHQPLFPPMFSVYLCCSLLAELEDIPPLFAAAAAAAVQQHDLYPLMQLSHCQQQLSVLLL